jgi:RNA polymerase sigma-70 factor, ECF subfamily
MPESTPLWSLEALQANEAWLRPLVRSLVDDSTTSDVLQQTWLKAWQRPPSNPRGLRRWLHTVATNFARSHRRSQRRQQIVQAAAVRDGHQESTAATVERLSLHRSVSQAVVELPEPYRTVILLRHYHGLEIAAIAERTATSAANVRQRLHRGHECLRQHLEHEVGRDWPRQPAVVALLGIPLEPTAPLLLTSGAATLAMNKFQLAVTTLLLGGLIGGGWLLFHSQRPAPIATVDQPLGQTGSAEAATTFGSAVPAAAAPTERELASDARAAPIAATVAGTVVDTANQPVAGVRFEFSNFDPSDVIARGESDNAGRFSLPAWPERWHHLRAAPPWVVLAAAAPANDVPALLVATPGGDLVVRVIDADGAPIANATAAIEVRALLAFRDSLERARQIDWPKATTNTLGRATLAGIPRLDTTLTVKAEGFLPQRMQLDASTPSELMINMSRLPANARAITGTVTDARGAPIVEALVGIGRLRTASDRYGGFHLAIPADAKLTDAPLYAAAEGWFPVRIAEFGRRLPTGPGVLEQDLHLTQPVLTISGRVVDADAKPCANVLVYPWDLDYLRGAALDEGTAAEDLAAPKDVETLSFAGNPLRAYARTDADGKFAIRAFTAKDYLFRVYDDNDGWAWTSPPITAGTRDALLRLPAPTHGSIAGRITTLDQTPAAGVRLGISVPVLALQGGFVSLGKGIEATTDSEGRFRFDDVPSLGCTLSASGIGWEDASVDLSKEPDPMAIALRMVRSCLFRVECSGPAFAKAELEVTDASGKVLVMTERRDNIIAGRYQVVLNSGRSGTHSVSELATTIILRAGNREERIPLRLVPGEITAVIDPVR